MNKINGIYGIRSISHPERVYIGSSINIRKRWYLHKRQLFLAEHGNIKLQNHYNKYGEHDLVFEIIIQCDREYLLQTEQAFINLFNPWFNIFPAAGSPSGYRHSDEARAKISKIHKGIPFSEEHKKKIGDAQRGRVASPDEVDRLRKINIGRPGWNKGGHLSEETKEKLRKANMGKKASSESRRRMSEAGRNKPPVSLVTRARLSENNKSSKIIINIETGIYYDSIIKAAFSRNKPARWLTDKLTGKTKNNTMFRYA